MKVWIARDENGELYMYNVRPIKFISTFYFIQSSGSSARLPLHWFPEITWDDEPVEFELKRKEGSV